MFDKNFSFDPSEFTWAGIEDHEIRSILASDINPLAQRTKFERDNPGLREAYIMANCPEYLHWTCKTLFNIEISPMQACILYMLWSHSFPLLCGSRGLGKAILPKEKIRVKDGWKAIENINVGDKVYGGNGILCNVTGKTDLMKGLNFYRVTFDDGAFLDCCEDHNWKYCDSKDFQWKVATTKKLLSSNKNLELYIPESGTVDDKIYYESPFLYGDGLRKIVSIKNIGKKDGMCISVDSPDKTYITKDYIVTHNSFLLGTYALLRASLVQGSKIVCVGAGFRQSKVIFGYVESLWRNAPVLRSIYKGGDDGPKQGNDMFTFTVGQSKIFFIPLGPGGEKVRGLRANIIIADEMNSMDTDIYEIVVNNFAAVSMNPIEKMKKEAKIKYYKSKKLNIPSELLETSFQNQSVISGTMGFEHQPMCNYWRKYKDIIDSKGKSLKDAFDGADVDLSYKDFSIIRVPYELISKGYMDDKTIARAKATIHIGAYNSEYGCVPVKDSTGFFRRSIIDQCVANDKAISNDISWPDWCKSSFDAKLKGDKNHQYVMGVDPASETDNFAISIIEVHPDHQRVVYNWTINREEVRKIDVSANYYAYCARHIRYLCNKFNIAKIGIDAQGGGISLSEALHDKDTIRKGESLFWEEIDRDKPKDTDNMDGEHLIRLIQFSNYAWLANANHSLRKDLESRTILFPRYNSAILGLASESSIELEDTIMNIEELKDELCTIIMTSTGNRERWDTPQVRVDSNKIGRMRKDRYSSLLIANDLAREINKDLGFHYERPEIGCRVGEVKKKQGEVEPAYYGPKAVVDALSNMQVSAIYRG